MLEPLLFPLLGRLFNKEWVEFQPIAGKKIRICPSCKNEALILVDVYFHQKFFFLRGKDIARDPIYYCQMCHTKYSFTMNEKKEIYLTPLNNIE